MPFFGNTEYQIGRGEVAESRVELPLFAAFLFVCAILVFAVQLYFHNIALSTALAISLMVMGVTILRVDLGVYILVASMLLSPEITLQASGSKMHDVNVRYDDILIITIFLGVMVRVAWEGRNQWWRPSAINVGIVLYLIVCVLSTARAHYLDLGRFDRMTSLFVLLKMLQYFLIFWLVGNAMKRREDIRNQVILFLLVAVIMSAATAMQIGQVGRVSSPFETGGTEPNTLGGYLTLCMCVAAALYTQAPMWRHKITFLIIIGIALLPFLYTLSRASYLALLAGILVVGFRAKNWVLITVIVGALLFSQMIMPEEVRQRVNYTFQEGSGEDVYIAGRETGLQVDKSTYERIYVWQKVWHNLHVWPWFGGGVSWDSILDSHYARVIIETGLLGLATFLLMQLNILKVTNQAFKWSGDWFSRGVALGTFSGAIAMIVHSAGTITFLIVRIMSPFWFLVALSVVIRQIAIEEYQAQKRREAGVLADEEQPGPSARLEPEPVRFRPEPIARPL
jgi:hypothetical protein